MYLFSKFLPTLVSCLLDESHSNRYELIHHYSFDLHFPDDCWYWTSFYVFVGHLYVLVALCILKIEFFFFLLLTCVSYLHILGINPLRICFEKYFSHSTGCLFIFMLLCRSFLVLYSSAAAAAAAKLLQSCLTLCDPINGSPPGSPVPGILQARTLEWVAIAFSVI